MDDLVTWLREQLDEDERDWQMVAALDVMQMLHGMPLAPRMLAEVAAKRAILDLHSASYDLTPAVAYGVLGPPPPRCGSCRTDLPCLTVFALAQPFAGRPSWREEWAT